MGVSSGGQLNSAQKSHSLQGWFMIQKDNLRHASLHPSFRLAARFLFHQLVARPMDEELSRANLAPDFPVLRFFRDVYAGPPPHDLRPLRTLLPGTLS